MNKSGNEYYHSIKGLLIPRSVKYETIDKSINKYIDVADSLAISLEKAFNSKKYEIFINKIEITLSLLNAVYARWLENDALTISRYVKDDKADQVTAKIKPFVTELLTLSIEMQKAQNAAGKEVARQGINTIEDRVEVVHNLSAIETLISEGNYRQAKSMTIDLKEKYAESMLTDLIDCYNSRKYTDAINLIKIIKEKHMDEIKDFAVSDNASEKIVLTVDDKPEILSIITSLLKNYYKVYGVTSGTAALKLLQTKNPELFIFDVDMPGMDGYELASTVRGKTEHAKTPIIFLTGNSSREHVLKAMQAGGSDFIVKPANNDVLLAKVRKYLE